MGAGELAADSADVGDAFLHWRDEECAPSRIGAAVNGFYLSVEGQRALTRAGKIPARRGIKSSSDDIDRLLDSGNLHVIRTEGEYSRYMKLYNEVLGTH